MGGSQEAEKSSMAKDGDSLLNFGDYSGWAYGDMLAWEPNYVAYICMGSKDSIEEPQQFQEWIALKNYEF